MFLKILPLNIYRKWRFQRAKIQFEEAEKQGYGICVFQNFLKASAHFVRPRTNPSIEKMNGGLKSDSL